MGVGRGQKSFPKFENLTFFSKKHCRLILELESEISPFLPSPRKILGILGKSILASLEKIFPRPIYTRFD